MKPKGNTVKLEDWLIRQHRLSHNQRAQLLGKSHNGLTAILERNRKGVDYRVEITGPNQYQLWIKPQAWKRV